MYYLQTRWKLEKNNLFTMESEKSLIYLKIVYIFLKKPKQFLNYYQKTYHTQN